MSENSGIHVGVTQAHEECVMKIKERKKKKQLRKILLMEEGLYMAVSEDRRNRFL